MPTDVLLSIEEKRAAQKRVSADVWAYVLLIPLILCLGSLVLESKYPAFASAIIATGEE